MAGQPGFFDAERLKVLSAAGDPLVRLAAVVDFELFRGELETALERSDRSKGGRPPYDAVLMFKALVLQTLYTLSDDGHRVSAEGSAVVHALLRPGAARSGARRQDDLALSRTADPRRGDRSAVRAVRCHLARTRLSGDGRTDRRCDGDRGTPATAQPRRERDDQGRRRAPGLEPGAHPADRPRRPVDAEARPKARTVR